jgi:hypothetical protein
MRTPVGITQLVKLCIHLCLGLLVSTLAVWQPSQASATPLTLACGTQDGTSDDLDERPHFITVDLCETENGLFFSGSVHEEVTPTSDTIVI